MERSRWYPGETITNAVCADDLILLPNTPVQVKSLLHCMEKTTRGISFYMNSDKTEFICFDQDGGISSLNEKPL